MRIGITLLIVVAALIATGPASGQAELTSAFTYQGRIKQNDGLVTDACDFVFRLFDAEDMETGVQVGPTLTFDAAAGNGPAVDVEKGLFSVELDFGDPSIFDGTALWLQIEVGCGEATQLLTGRQKITAIPESVHAASPWETDIDTGDVTIDSPVGIGLPNPQTRFHVEADFPINYVSRIDNLSTTGLGLRIKSGDDTGFDAILRCESDSFSRFTVYDGGRVAVGDVVMPQSELHVAGTITASCGTVSCSDARLKRNIVGLSHSLATVLALRGVTFEWRTNEYPKRRFAEGRQIGLIAQEVRDVLPEVVSGDEEGTYSVAYDGVIPILIEAVKELNGVVENKDTLIAEQRRELDEVKQRLARLESLVLAAHVAEESR